MNRKKKFTIIISSILAFVAIAGFAVIYSIQNSYHADMLYNPTYFGCKNTTTAKCIHLINNSENGITIDNPSNLGTASGTHRPLLIKKTIIMSVPAFNVDASGFPLTDMMLEVKFKDTILAKADTDTAKVFQRIDYTATPQYPAFQSLSLGKKGLGGETIKQALFAKNNFQRLRSVDGKFVFKFIGGSLDLPIEYISITKISSTDAEAFKKWQRDSDPRKLVELSHIETNTPPSFAGDFVTYSSSVSKQIFPNSIPTVGEINKNINITTALGEYEPIPISIYTKKDLSDVTVSISDLSFGKDKIAKENIQVRKVVYDYRGLYRLNYGLQPDRIEKFDKINIKANTSQQFWLTVAVPSNIGGGKYLGTITITANNGAKKIVNVNLDVLPMALKDTKQVNAIYFTPESSANFLYSLNKDAVYADMTSHEINSAIDGVTNGATATITDKKFVFNTDVIKTRLQNSVDKGLVKQTMLYTNMQGLGTTIVSKLDAFYKANHGSSLEIDGEIFLDSPKWEGYTPGSGSPTDIATLWTKFSDPRFKKAYVTETKQLIYDVHSIKSANGSSIEPLFQVVDEPGNGKYSRVYTDILFRYIREAEGKTWETYHNTCREEVACPECQPCPHCTVKGGVPYLPSLADLIDNKVYAMYDVADSNVKTDQVTFGFYDTFYSQNRNPIYNRFIHGLFAEKTNAKVTAIYAYGGIFSDPYNDFDTEYYYSYVDFLLAYPTWSADGEMIPTMAWEGLREGIKDDKYIETLRDLISKYPDQAKAKEADAYLISILNKISMDWRDQYSSNSKASGYGYDKLILQTVSKTNSPDDYAAFDDVRNTIIQYIKDLSAPVTPPVTPTPAPTPPPAPPQLNLSSSNFYTSWNMVSFPDLSSGVTDDSLIPSGLRTRRYDGGSNKYIKGETDLITLTPGQGYWLKVDDTNKINGLKYPLNQTSTTQITVTKGWNLLGNPYQSDLPLSNLIVKYKDGTTRSYADAIARKEVSGYGWSWEAGKKQYYFVAINTNNYKTSSPKNTVIKPYRGFWMIVKSSEISDIIMTK